MQRTLCLCVFILMHNTLDACNICGCSALSSNPGILPGFRYHIAGIRASHRSFISEHPASILNPEKTQVRDYYSTLELWGRWFPSKHIQLFASLPYNSFSTGEKGLLKKRAGLGDASVLANYLLINTLDSNRRFRHLLSIGAGMKFRTGDYINDGLPYFQTGSGTRDLRLYSSYTITSDRAGLLTEFNYSLPGVNPEQYQSGKKLQGSLRFYASRLLKSFRLLPSLGLLYEHSSMDRLNGSIQDNTGGRLLVSGLGIDIYYKSFMLNTLINVPFSQHLGKGLVKENNRIQIGFSYLIPNKKIKNCQ